MSEATQAGGAAVEAPEARPAAYPNARRAWYMVSLLTVAYVVSFVDRSILGLLIDPIKADLGLSDFQIGL
ncbi:MAG: MFS transporter, partial [Gammaproteobacteria bacterium]|nr:MFS transporter [Gammaproteobacteria bacterium]